MKRIKVPRIERYRKNPQGQFIPSDDGGWVDWVEIRMLLSILAGFGIIEVSDSDFELSDIEIEEDIFDDGVVKKLRALIDERNEQLLRMTEKYQDASYKLTKIRELVAGIEHGDEFTEDILRILDDTAEEEPVTPMVLQPAKGEVSQPESE
jgi:hypothetical protein